MAAHKLIVLRGLCNRCVMLVRHFRRERFGVWLWAFGLAIASHIVVMDWFAAAPPDALPAPAVRLRGVLQGVGTIKQEERVRVGETLASPTNEFPQDPPGTARQSAAARPVSGDKSVPPALAEAGPQHLRQDESEGQGQERWRKMTVAEARVYWRLQVAGEIRAAGLPAEGRVVLRVDLPWRDGTLPELIRSSGQEAVDQAWRVALTDALARVPPPESLQMEGLPVDFEWAP